MTLTVLGASLVAQSAKNPPHLVQETQETALRSLGGKIPGEGEMVSQVFYRDSFNVGLSVVFSLLALQKLERKTIEGKCHAQRSRCTLLAEVITADVDLGHLWKSTSARFLHCKVTPATFQTAPFRRKSHLRECRVMFPLLEEEPVSSNLCIFI